MACPLGGDRSIHLSYGDAGRILTWPAPDVTPARVSSRPSPRAVMMRAIMKYQALATAMPAPPLRSFAALMELYETNFMLMRRLMPDMAGLSGTRASQGGEGLPLHVEVLEQGRFTTVVRLFYRLPCEGGGVRDAPDLQVRVYHDARVAEAVAGRLRGRDCSAQGQAGERCLDVRWRLNRFLYKWLRYLLHRQQRIEASSG